MIYARWANNRQDAVADRLRRHIEDGTLATGDAA
jgi:DNA-binding FadR family transcriptional regulator